MNIFKSIRALLLVTATLSVSLSAQAQYQAQKSDLRRLFGGECRYGGCSFS